MSEKWTPGPWSVMSSPHSTGTRIWGRDPRDRRDDPRRRIIIADAYEVPPDDRTNRFNAHLIAAAPELYAALSCFLDDPRFQVGVGGNPDAVDEMISAARAALAKARGETVDG